MFFLKRNLTNPSFVQGALELLPACFGIFTWGMMTGVAMIHSGLNYPESLMMTFCVFAGSSQLAVLPLLAARAPIWVILATAFCVNLRFVVFSAHLRNYLNTYPRGYRVMCAYFTADLSYIQFIKRFPIPAHSIDQKAIDKQTAYLAGSNALNWFSWMLGSLTGLFLTQFIPIDWGLGFAGFLALLGVAMTLVSSHLRLLAAVLSGVLAVYFVDLPLKLNTMLAILISIAVCDQFELYAARQLKPKN